mmetsp:Transcript_1780/g.4503  ORF Transcript_1780/g.4503 Transcript_1780/m.4503 type:complete len:248 (-) Transcript_1780:914-1657(-)
MYQRGKDGEHSARHEGIVASLMSIGPGLRAQVLGEAVSMPHFWNGKGHVHATRKELHRCCGGPTLWGVWLCEVGEQLPQAGLLEQHLIGKEAGQVLGVIDAPREPGSHKLLGIVPVPRQPGVHKGSHHEHDVKQAIVAYCWTAAVAHGLHHSTESCSALHYCNALRLVFSHRSLQISWRGSADELQLAHAIDLYLLDEKPSVPSLLCHLLLPLSLVSHPWLGLVRRRCLPSGLLRLFGLAFWLGNKI